MIGFINFNNDWCLSLANQDQYITIYKAFYQIGAKDIYFKITPLCSALGLGPKRGPKMGPKIGPTRIRQSYR